MKFIDDSMLKVIKSFMPKGSHFVLIIAMPEGTTVDTDILDPIKAKDFVLETAYGMIDPSRN